MSGNGETAGSPNARQALLTAVDEHAGDAGAPVGDVIEAALEDVNGGLGRVCSALQQLHADGEVYQPNPTTVWRVATDGGQLTQRQQRQAEKLQLKHAAEQGREQRLQTALETGEVGKQGQRIWIIPEFEPDEAESDYIGGSVREALPEYDCQVVYLSKSDLEVRTWPEDGFFEFSEERFDELVAKARRIALVIEEQGIADSVEDVPFDRCGCYFCQEEELDV